LTGLDLGETPTTANQIPNGTDSININGEDVFKSTAQNINRTKVDKSLQIGFIFIDQAEKEVVDKAASAEAQSLVKRSNSCPYDQNTNIYISK
jgi:hypothetical protein